MNSKLSLQNHHLRELSVATRVRMSKKNNRIDYLSLDSDLVKNRHDYVPRVKYALSKSGAWEIMPLDQKFPFAFSAAKQVEYSCNKIGTRLFGAVEGEFNLRDPYLYQSRFTIEYNSLYDPSLESYYNRRPVRKKLRQLKIINEKGDAICSRRYFFEYVRYLEKRRADKIVQESANRVCISIDRIDAA